jgi:hypothetical protein
MPDDAPVITITCWLSLLSLTAISFSFPEMRAVFRPAQRSYLNTVASGQTMCQ